jgi:hypothetical protein
VAAVAWQRSILRDRLPAWPSTDASFRQRTLFRA